MRAVSSVASGLGLRAGGQHATEQAQHLLFVPGERYRLVVAEGRVPAPGATVVVDDRPHVVVRTSPSPLPGDPRRCAILEAPHDPAPGDA